MGIMESKAPARDEIEQLLRAEHADPFSVLGPHVVDGTTAIRVLRPGATRVEILQPKRKAAPAAVLDPAGFFEASLPADKEALSYRLRVTYPTGSVEMERSEEHTSEL